MKTALVFGSTGLVGSYLVKELLDNPEYTAIKTFVRKPTGNNHPKLSEHYIDFENIAKSSDLLKGDELFICLGTTLKKAGSVANMEKIDRDLPVSIAAICRKNEVQKIAVVSSIGAKASSKNYYLRIKGEMENEIMLLPFSQVVLLRPSIILGKRNESRLAESISKEVMKVAGYLLFGKLKKYRAIHAKTIARAMISIIRFDLKETIYESDVVQVMGA
jgi:uncharacterized protein YbjT (DUF2867 family)